MNVKTTGLMLGAVVYWVQSQLLHIFVCHICIDLAAELTYAGYW